MELDLLPRAELERTGSGSVLFDRYTLIQASSIELANAEDVVTHVIMSNPDFEFLTEGTITGDLRISWRRRKD